MNELPPKPDITRATRGRFLPRHGARVIEQDDLLIVEFVAGESWYTAPKPAPKSLLAWTTVLWTHPLVLLLTGAAANTAHHLNK